jgi:hypothetical protein
MMSSEDLKWTTCCKGRASSCPEIAIDGDYVHIRDDYGAEVKLKRDNPILADQDEQMPGNDITIYGEDSKKPARMTLVEFYTLLETLDTLEGNPE